MKFAPHRRFITTFRGLTKIILCCKKQIHTKPWLPGTLGFRGGVARACAASRLGAPRKHGHRKWTFHRRPPEPPDAKHAGEPNRPIFQSHEPGAASRQGQPGGERRAPALAPHVPAAAFVDPAQVQPFERRSPGQRPSTSCVTGPPYPDRASALACVHRARAGHLYRLIHPYSQGYATLTPSAVRHACPARPPTGGRS